MATDNRIEINLSGQEAALAAMKRHPTAIRRGLRLGVQALLLKIQGRTKESFGEPGKPMRRTGHLSRSITHVMAEDAQGVEGRVGSTMPFKTGYAAILELGGQIPAMTIVPKRAKFLRWFTGYARITMAHHLASGATVKQATQRTLKAHRLGSYGTARALGHGPKVSVFRPGRGERIGAVVFAKKVHIPARYQRAMPYLRPAFDEARPHAEEIVRGHVKKAIGSAVKGES